MSVMQRHEFALYYPGLSDEIGPQLTIADRAVVQRVTQVLRLRVGETIMLFDRQMSVQGTLSEVIGKRLVLDLGDPQDIVPLAPSIRLGLPLLKRADLERAVYSAVELGANEIQLLQTEKSERHCDEKNVTRLERIMIAAAEQSKQFALPAMRAPLSIEQWCAAQTSSDGDVRIHFDGTGRLLASVAADFERLMPASVALVVGPEGDLVKQERQVLRAAGFEFCALTPTILRAHQAVAVGLGSIRSLLR